MLPRRVTAEDVARLSGVSRSAVSRTFTPGASVSSKTREKVVKAATQLGYSPNSIASALAKRQADLVAIVISHLTDLREAFLFEMLTKAIQKRGRQALLVYADPSNDVDERLRRAVSYQVSSLLVFADGVSAATASAVSGYGRPIMLNGRWRPGDRVDAVVIDEAGGIKEMGDAAAHAGHRRIAFVRGRRTALADDERRQALLETIAANGLQLTAEGRGDFTYEGGFEEAIRIIEADGVPDLIFCSNDTMALGVMDAVRYRLGLRVPEDVSIIGFDDIPMASWPSYNLTTIRQSNAAIVDAILETLDHREADPGGEPTVREVGTVLCRRTSARL